MVCPFLCTQASSCSCPLARPYRLLDTHPFAKREEEVMAAFLGLVVYLLLAMALGNGGRWARPNAWAGEVERDNDLTCPQDCVYDYGLAGSTAGPVKRQLGSGSRVEDDRPRASPKPVPV